MIAARGRTQMHREVAVPGRAQYPQTLTLTTFIARHRRPPPSASTLCNHEHRDRRFKQARRIHAERLGQYVADIPFPYYLLAELACQVLTDRICKACSKVPLMRSPTDSTIFFCANCDSQPHPSDAAGSSSASSIDSASHVSRTSTPLTEVSSTLSSPTFEPPVDTEEIMRRRQQSDMASTEIGKRLLKGWAMLADECPNEHCYGIPLVRPPKSGGDKDSRKVRRQSVRIVTMDHIPFTGVRSLSQRLC